MWGPGSMNFFLFLITIELKCVTVWIVILKSISDEHFTDLRPRGGGGVLSLDGAHVWHTDPLCDLHIKWLNCNQRTDDVRINYLIHVLR